MIFSDKAFSVVILTKHLTTMPSSKKELPNARKRVTASDRARTSVKKTRRVGVSELDGSYLQKTKKTVSSSDAVKQRKPAEQSDNETILSLLQDIKHSNELLSKRMDKVEQQAVQGSTPINPRSHTFEPKGLSSQPVSPQQTSQANLANYLRDSLGTQNIRQPQFQTAAADARPSQGQHLRRQPNSHILDPAIHMSDNSGQLSEHRDTVIPNIQALRGNAGISEAVNNLLASYGGNFQAELTRGKQNVKKSGRYNTHDSIAAPPHLRWPNEGCHSSNGKKRVTYDELSMPQWVAGQLTNIYNISDPTLVKQAILQMIFAMRDATTSYQLGTNRTT